MKIGTCNGGERVELERLNAREKGETGHAGFRELLDGELSSSPASVAGGSSELESSGGISALQGLMPLSGLQTDGVDSGVMEGVEHAEMALDEISARLNDEGAGPREMERVVMSLKSASEKLETTLEGVSNDHPLGQLGQGLSVLAYVESVKWKRGDYLE